MDNGDGTVTDTCTGLMWQKDTADVNGSGAIEIDPFPGDRLSWQEGLKYCQSLDLGGHDDWRLPNVRELQSLVDYGRALPCIDPAFGALSLCYWSSSTYVDIPGDAWILNFFSGNVDYLGKTYSYFIRAVRNAP